MNKSFHAFIALCCLLSFQTHAKCGNGKLGRLSVKPSISLNLNRRSLSGNVLSSTYTGDLTDTILGASGNANATGKLLNNEFNNIHFNVEKLVRNFIQHPFSNPHDPHNITLDGGFDAYPATFKINNNNVGSGKTDYLGPGRVWVDSSSTSVNDKSATWTLKKAGTNDEAVESDAITGSNLLFLSNSQIGKNFLPVLDFGEAGSTGKLLKLIRIPFDNLTDKFDMIASYPAAATDTNISLTKNHISVSKDSSGVYSTTMELMTTIDVEESNKDPNKYATPGDIVGNTESESYYIILVGSANFNAARQMTNPGNPYPAIGRAEIHNNAKSLLLGKFNAPENDKGNLEYKQDDVDQINYVGMSLGVNASYYLSDFIHLTVSAGTSAPIEKIEHSGKHISVNPEINFNTRVGALVGNCNGSIGLLIGFQHDRYSSIIKKMSGSGGQHSLTSTKVDLEENFLINSLVANIKLNDQVEAFFSSTISEKDLKANAIKELANPNPTIVSYDFGINLVLDQA
ncbi:MAG: hypothetical protein VXW87_03955 [Pseudomonadota bacterium]|nr:hypothetical protein [Pseudomonadota bacterium]